MPGRRSGFGALSSPPVAGQIDLAQHRLIPRSCSIAADTEVSHDRPEQAIPVVETLINTFGDWLKHRRELNELRQLNTSDFDRIAGDLRVSPGDLDELVRHGPHAADELPKMLKALGIDEEALARTAAAGAARHGARLRDVPPQGVNATATSPPAPPPSITRAIAPTRRRSTCWAAGQNEISRAGHIAHRHARGSRCSMRADASEPLEWSAPSRHK